MLVRKRREGNWSKLATLKPMHRSSVDGNGLLGRYVGAVLEVVVLTLLLRLEPKTSQTTEILLNNGLIDGSTPLDTLSVVVRNVGPPIGLSLDVTKDHILDGGRHAGDLPRNVGLPTTECLRQMRKNHPGLVLLDALGHHIQNVVHHAGTQFQVEMTFNSLLGHILRKRLGVTTLELTSEEITKPTLEKGGDAAQEEQPDSPAWRPKADTRTLTDWTGIESIVDQVLQVLAHSDLPHQTILVPIHARELADVVEGILQTVRVLISIDIAKAELHMSINNELG